jgi:hypothetical protein
VLLDIFRDIRVVEPSIVLSTDQEMIRAGNTIHAHAPDFIVNDELLVPILRTFSQCNQSLHAT